MSKYNAVPTNGYASKAEAQRAGELKLMEAAGVIYDLRKQVSFELVPKQQGERSVTYIADFVYRLTKDGLVVVEDVKGVRTPLYVVKRKLMLWLLGIRIKEVR